VVTLHRFENLYNYEAVHRIVSIVESISQKHFLVFILHKPTEIKLKKFKLYGVLDNNPNIELRERYDYFKFIKLILEAEFVISDGGSNQEECYFLGKPILLLRKATERYEGLSENCVLSQFDPIVIDEFINNIGSYQHDLKQLPFFPSKIIVDNCKTFI
jgi:UDP-N-acetylglucosamine 2-epimerase (non-hydrolysing)